MIAAAAADATARAPIAVAATVVVTTVITVVTVTTAAVALRPAKLRLAVLRLVPLRLVLLRLALLRLLRLAPPAALALLPRLVPRPPLPRVLVLLRKPLPPRKPPRRLPLVPLLALRLPARTRAFSALLSLSVTLPFVGKHSRSLRPRIFDQTVFALNSRSGKSDNLSRISTQRSGFFIAPAPSGA